MTRLGLILILIFSQLLISCNENINETGVLKFKVKTKVIYFNPSNTHELIVYGNKIGSKIFPEKICVRKVANIAEEIEYKPIDQASLETSGFDLTYAWSPDGNYLVLPRGRFEGFTVFSTNQLPKALEKGKGNLAIAVKGTVGSNWWHDFSGWKNENTILFNAGLSEDSFSFEWNIETYDLVSLDLKREEYEIDTTQ